MVWFIILSILWKKIILNTLGRIARSYELYAGRENFLLFPRYLLRGFHRKNCFKMEWYSFCSYMGPNQERIMDQMASRLSVWPLVSFIKTGTYKGIGQRLIGFCVYVSVVVRRFATGDVFVYLQWITFWIFPNLVWLSWPNMEATITSFTIAR